MRMLLRVLQDGDSKPALQIAKDLAGYTVHNREVPRAYFKKLMYKQDVTDLGAYVSERESAMVVGHAQDDTLSQFYKNKVLFDRHFSSSGLATPRRLAYNIGRQFFRDGQVLTLESSQETRAELRRLLSRAEGASVFAKQIHSCGGKDAFRIDRGKIDDEAGALHEAIVGGQYLFQEAIAQHEKMREAYPHSLNTLRVMTCIDEEHRVSVISAVARFGSGGSVVDSASQGGMFVGVDLETGKAKPPGAKTFQRYGGHVFPEHPDTGYRFEALEVPFFEAALEMARAAARHLPHPFIGWDIAITETGPCLVEGNEDPDIETVEIGSGGLKKNEAFRAFLSQVKARS